VPAQAQLTSRQAVSTTDMVSTMQISETAIQESRDKRDAETLSKEFEMKEHEWKDKILEHQTYQRELLDQNSKLKQEVQDKGRENARFQSEIDNLNRALQAKDEEARKNHKVARDLEGQVRILQANKEVVEDSKHELNKAREEGLLAKKQLEEKEKELRELRWKYQNKENQDQKLALLQQDIQDLQAEIQREQATSALAMKPGEMNRLCQESPASKTNDVVRLEAELCDTKGELDKAMRTIASMTSQR